MSGCESEQSPLRGDQHRKNDMNYGFVSSAHFAAVLKRWFLLSAATGLAMAAETSLPARSIGVVHQAGGNWEIDVPRSKLRISVDSVAGTGAAHEQSRVILFLRATTLEEGKLLRALRSVEVGEISACWDWGSYKASSSWSYPTGFGYESVPLNEGGVRLVFGAWLDSPGMGATIQDLLSIETFEVDALQKQWIDSVGEAIGDGSEFAAVSRQVLVSQRSEFLVDRSGYGTARVSYSIYLDPYITWRETPDRQDELKKVNAVPVEVFYAEESARKKAESEVAEKESVIAKLREELLRALPITRGDIEEIDLASLWGAARRLTVGAALMLFGGLAIVWRLAFTLGRRRRAVVPSRATINDRRRAYKRLRGVLEAVLREAAVSSASFPEIHKAVHDVDLYFPDAVARRVRPIVSDCAELYASGQVLASAARTGGADERHAIEVQKNAEALQRIIALDAELLELFKPHLVS
jgi:hypothetical protein